MPLVKGQLVAIQDADLEYDPVDLDRLIATACKNPNSIVYGSRYHGRNSVRRMSFFRLGVCVLNCLLLALYRIRLTDVMTGYKVFPTEALFRMELECQRFEFCTEVTAKAVRLGIPIIEVPVTYLPRSKRDGKKIRWRDGWRNAWNLLRLQRWKPNLASNQLNAVDENAGY
jgi:hypothetical protein